MSEIYSQEYFDSIGEASRSSAAAVVPRVVDMIQPQSVVDVGCGQGEWAAAFKQCGVEQVLGVDGAQVQSQLRIEPHEFVAADLTQPMKLDRKFDLAVSLEVAEHLPASAGETLIATLASLAPAVLFSAAIPHQSGRHHVNEQWPDYWAKLFSKYEFTPCDVLRTQFWGDARVEWWYAQNMLLYVKPELLDRLPKHERNEQGVLSVVHPANYQRLVWRERVLTACVDLAAAVPPQSRVILADEDRFGDVYLPDRTVVPFTESNGAYAGPPADDQAALRELDKQIQLGADYFAIGWPAFWHFDHYQRLAQRLLKDHRQVLRNDNVILFEL